jgi:hypothetical protein
VPFPGPTHTSHIAPAALVKSFASIDCLSFGFDLTTAAIYQATIYSRANAIYQATMILKKREKRLMCNSMK